MFDEYMFSSFFFRPTSPQMLERILKRVLVERYMVDQGLNQSDKILADITHKYLEEVYDDFFSLIYTQLKNYTVSINEYIYFFTFLYPEYMGPAIKKVQNS